MANLNRREFIKLAGATAAAAVVIPAGLKLSDSKVGTMNTPTVEAKPVPGKGGDHYIPYKERSGKESIVFFTRDLSPEGLEKMYDRISSVITGNVGIKLHTGEPHGPNIIPRPWVKQLIADKLPKATIVETNTYYQSPL